MLGLLKTLLGDYKKASGQKINFAKSTITFSPNTKARSKRGIILILGLSDAKSHDKYLGLPTVVGKNLKHMFANIVDRVRTRVESWRRSLFSIGGREILVKAVLQSIPTYVMSLFRIPVALVKKFRSLFLNFWCGTWDGKRKISRIKWDDICHPKALGGLGFRDIRIFNQSLVAKQVWRLLSYPNSLAEQVLKGKCCKNGSLIDATDKNGFHWLWKSLL